MELEKLARKRQVKENKFRRKYEQKQQEAIDTYLVDKVKEELMAEQNFAKLKKQHQADAM